MAKVLIVDDDWNVCHVLTSGLRKEGFDVNSANNAKTALLKLKETSYDFLVTDMKMPDINGFILATIVKELHPHIKIIFMSGFDIKNDKMQYKEFLNFPFLSKPFKLLNLIHLLEIEKHPMKAVS